MPIAATPFDLILLVFVIGNAVGGSIAVKNFRYGANSRIIALIGIVIMVIGSVSAFLMFNWIYG